MKLTLHLLHDDRPTGPRIAKIEDPNEVLKRKELDGPCLYFLVAKAGSATAPRPRVYVGEADGFRSRTSQDPTSAESWLGLCAGGSGGVLVEWISTLRALTPTRGAPPTLRV